MGKIVGAFATSHVLFSPDGVDDAAERVFAGMMQIRVRIAALRPDAAIIINSDHMNNFTLKAQVTLAVGVADSFTPLGDMGLPRTPFPGCRALAEAISRRSAAAGFDLTQVEEVEPDHGMALSKLIADVSNSLPIVPLYINMNMPVPPSPARCYALGAVLKEAVEKDRPADERVIVVAGGGLSHWLSTTGHGTVAEAFDRHFMTMMVSGQSAELAKISLDELERESGNGGLELGCWLCMAGSVPEAKGEIVYYEPIPLWDTGMGGLELKPLV